MPPLLNPIRSSLESGALLDRGGRPTLRELLGGLAFDATTGALRLNKERVTLQLSEADRILRRELIQMLGEDEARVFLLRRGFRMGLNDAAFVARSWPALDRGDAFTAGTRLHMFSGIVRVETLHNDFDFARGRFSAEFHWHNSVEAEGVVDTAGRAERPVCWQQLGYASGYATHFFGALVVYKETACAAQGHRACKVVGRLATGWGDDDPEVVLFRSRIVPSQPPGMPTGSQTAPLAGGPRPGAVWIAPDVADAALLAPIADRLDLAARLPLPVLIAGSGSCGQEIAARHLAQRLAPADGPLRLQGAGLEAEALRAALAQARKGRRKDQAPAILVDGIEALSPDLQDELARELSRELVEVKGRARTALIATAALPLSDLAAGRLSPMLWARLAPLAMELPALAARTGDLARIAALRAGDLAARLGLHAPGQGGEGRGGQEKGREAGDEPGQDRRRLFGTLSANAVFAPLTRCALPGGLDTLDAILTAALIMPSRPITAVTIEAAIQRVVPPGSDSVQATRSASRSVLDTGPGGDLAPAADETARFVAARLSEGGFSLDLLEAQLRAAALARTGGNLAAAARLLGISRAQLAYRQRNGADAAPDGVQDGTPPGAR